jgi:hypothetical protein
VYMSPSLAEDLITINLCHDLKFYRVSPYTDGDMTGIKILITMG